MTRAASTRLYGKPAKRSQAERLFSELPQSPLRLPAKHQRTGDHVDDLTKSFSKILIEEVESNTAKPVRQSPRRCATSDSAACPSPKREPLKHLCISIPPKEEETWRDADELSEIESKSSLLSEEETLRILSWDDLCSPEDGIEKIAEASFAEVYRISNERGTSIIKVIRLPSPIKPLTKAQVRARLIDEEPHEEDMLAGELQISEWLAEIPGFVVYKERFIVQGKTSRQVLETHQAFQRKLKRRDPGRAQFYPSPSRYLDETSFLVVELGDAGIALEHWDLTDESQLWDIFFLEAIALARGEDLAMFEHRDLHEGNLCIRRLHPPTKMSRLEAPYFGHSGLDITILDYGVSRAGNEQAADIEAVAFDLEKDPGMFNGTHGPHCDVYRRMRSYMAHGDCRMPPVEEYMPSHEPVSRTSIDWKKFAPYTNVLWLAYLYEYLIEKFTADRKGLQNFQRRTRELWKHLDPRAQDQQPWFASAGEVVQFGVEAGWISESQVEVAGCSYMDRESSIVLPSSPRIEEGLRCGRKGQESKR